MLINERIVDSKRARACANGDLSGRLNCYVILVNRGIPATVQLLDEVASRFASQRYTRSTRAAAARRQLRNRGPFSLSAREMATAPLRTDNETAARTSCRGRKKGNPPVDAVFTRTFLQTTFCAMAWFTYEAWICEPGCDKTRYQIYYYRFML